MNEASNDSVQPRLSNSSSWNGHSLFPLESLLLQIGKSERIRTRYVWNNQNQTPLESHCYARGPLETGHHVSGQKTTTCLQHAGEHNICGRPSEWNLKMKKNILKPEHCFRLDDLLWLFYCKHDSSSRGLLAINTSQWLGQLSIHNKKIFTHLT